MINSGLSVFFPAYNEEAAIAQAAAAARAIVPKLFRDHEIIIVDDGSRDGTAAAADRFARANRGVRVVHHPQNRGYGAAIRSGLAAATKELVFFTDGDNQFDIAELKNLLPLLPGADLVIGYRLKRRDPWHRLLFAKAYGLLIGLLFDLWVRDIDCAFKLLRRSVVNKLDLKADGALISAELLIKARKNGARIKEVGVHHYPRKGGRPTGANPAVVAKAFYELFKLRRELN